MIEIFINRFWWWHLVLDRTNEKNVDAVCKRCIKDRDWREKEEGRKKRREASGRMEERAG